MDQIDRAGTFICKVEEVVFSVSRANDIPQIIIKVSTLKKYADTADELAYYKITEPAYVDYTDQELTDYMTLYSKEGKESLNFQQVTKTLGWDGLDFQTLTGAGVGKDILVRVEANDPQYAAKRPFNIRWIDTTDAPPVRELQALDVAKTAALTAKFLSGKKAAANKPPVAKAVTANPTQAAAPAVSASAAKTAPKPAPKTAPTPKVAPPAAAIAAPPVSGTVGLPATTDKLTAWNYLNDPRIKGDNEDKVIEDAFLAAMDEVAPGKGEDLTPEQWAKVRDAVLKDLGATPV